MEIGCQGEHVCQDVSNERSLLYKYWAYVVRVACSRVVHDLDLEDV